MISRMGRSGVVSTNLRHAMNPSPALPPENRPTSAEAACCRGFLTRELSGLASLSVIVALGRIAHQSVLHLARAHRSALKLKDFPFAHGGVHRLPAPLPILIDTYHPSRYNVNTGRLTYSMFSSVLKKAREIAEE